MLLLIFLATFACGVPTSGISDEVNHSSIPILTPTPEEIDLARIRKSISASIARFSQEMGVADLSLKKLSEDQREFRIWGDDGFGHLSLLIVRRTAETWDAFFYESLDANSDEKSSPRRRTRPLMGPKSGWNGVRKQFEDSGVGPPMLLVPDQNYSPPIPDEGVVLIEAKRGREYEFVWYRQFSQSPHGMKALALCSALEREFRIEIPCKNSP